jgi:hypothetical protein
MTQTTVLEGKAQFRREQPSFRTAQAFSRICQAGSAEAWG